MVAAMAARRSLHPAATALGAVAAAGIAAFAWGSLVERNRFTLRREVLPILDAGARPLSVLHLSDLHMAPWQTAKQNWIRSLARLEPDFIVNTGDNLGHEDGIEGVQRALDVFRGTPGVFVNGSNDYFGPVLKNPFNYFFPNRTYVGEPPKLDTGSLLSYFEDELGWLNLNNDARAMLVKGIRLELFGVNDAHRGWDRLDKLPGEIDELRENVEWDDARTTRDILTIGVTHAPYRRVLDAFVTHGARAIFAGHTHGGQVRIPGLPALVTNCDIPRDQAQGLSVWSHAGHTALLNVSAGLGTSIYAPVRFACPPEAVLVTFTARE
jgi:predicted MPP superfamily phosphohydrolase